MANVLEIIKTKLRKIIIKIIFQMMVNVSLRGICGIYIFLDQRQAKDAITDGANDKQIDAVYIDEDEQKYILYKGNTTLVNLLMQLL